jgi:hypothetical protein
MTRAGINRLNAQISTSKRHPAPRPHQPPIRKDPRRAPRNSEIKQSKEETAPGFVFTDLAVADTTRPPGTATVRKRTDESTRYEPVCPYAHACRIVGRWSDSANLDFRKVKNVG